MSAAEIISSPQNPRIKRLRRLRSRAEREEDWFLLEGRTLIREAMARGWEIESLYYSAGNSVQSNSVPSFQLSPKLLQSVSALEQSPGILAVSRKRIFPIEAVSLASRSVLLAGIQDPGNMGALLRSAAAFGSAAVLTSPGTVHVYNPKVTRAAMGAMFHLQLCENVTPKQLAPVLQRENTELIVADSGSGEDPKSLPRNRNYVLALGHETLGVSREWRTLASKQVRIPISSVTQSLNVAVAGSILLYELTQKQVESRRSKVESQSED
jgi:TrmH family RNA methyltransferase